MIQAAIDSANGERHRDKDKLSLLNSAPGPAASPCSISAFIYSLLHSCRIVTVNKVDVRHTICIEPDADPNTPLTCLCLPPLLTYRTCYQAATRPIYIPAVAETFEVHSCTQQYDQYTGTHIETYVTHTGVRVRVTVLPL